MFCIIVDLIFYQHLFIAADSTKLNALTSQLKSMHFFAYPGSDRGHKILSNGSAYTLLLPHLLENEAVIDDVCTWNGVRCTDEVMKSISIHLESDTKRMADIDWLPATTECVHFVGLTFYDRWSASRLPRDLKYMYLYGCGAVAHSETHTIDLRRLPRKTEELYLVEADDALEGSVCISDLPQTMRILYIRESYIRSVYVLYETLPQKLIWACVTTGIKGMHLKFRGTGSVKSDKRVKESKSLSSLLVFESKYYEQFDSVDDLRYEFF